MDPHGHYSVPILFGGNTLGVLNIYLAEGHIRDNKEEEFLCTVANTLAGIIVRRRVKRKRKAGCPTSPGTEDGSGRPACRRHCP